MLEGGCSCGFVRYRVTGAPIFVNCCHCRDCQRSSGSAFAINAMIEAERVVLVGEGAPAPDNVPAGEGSMRCPRCATTVWGTHRMFGPAILFVHAGTLDKGEALAPDAHFFVRSKHPWIALAPEAVAFEALPEGGSGLWSAEARARLQAALGPGPGA